mgnify:CR=1 FL=1
MNVYFQPGDRVRLTRAFEHPAYPLQADDTGIVYQTSPDDEMCVEFDRYPDVWITRRKVESGKWVPVLAHCVRDNPPPAQTSMFDLSPDASSDRTYHS